MHDAPKGNNEVAKPMNGLDPADTTINDIAAQAVRDDQDFWVALSATRNDPANAA